MIRVMDEKHDATPLFYSCGDDRNVAKDRPPVPPGVPAALGGKFEVVPVTLPPESWYPGLKPFVRRDEIAKREAAITAATAELGKSYAAENVDAVRVAEARLVAAKS